MTDYVIPALAIVVVVVCTGALQKKGRLSPGTARAIVGLVTLLAVASMAIQWWLAHR